MLSGDEIAVRSYVLDVNYDSIYRDYQLDPEISAMVDQAFQNRSLEQKVHQRFRQFLNLMLDRFLTGHPIETLPDVYYGLTTKPEFTLINDLITEIGRMIQVTFPMKEQIFVMLPIIGMQTPTDVEKLGSIELHDEIDLLLTTILDRIKQKMNLSIELEKFRKEFLYHLMFMVNRLRFNITLQTNTLEDLVEKYPLAMQITEIAAEVIKEKLALTVTKNERTYLAAYFSVFLEENQHKKISFRVAIICSTGRVTARLIAAQLRKILDSTASLEFFSDDQVSTEMLNAFDMILTTISIDCPCNRPIIRINEIFDERKLRQKIEKVRFWDQVGIPALNNNWFITTGLLNESRFFMLDKISDYEAAVAHMVSCLTSSKQLDEGFAERLAKREQMGTMDFDHSVAIPHEIQFIGNQLLVARGIAPQVLHHKGHDIRIIFLLGLPQQIDHDDGLLIRVYDELIRISQDQQLLDELAKVSSYQHFLQTFYWQPH